MFGGEAQNVQRARSRYDTLSNVLLWRSMKRSSTLVLLGLTVVAALVVVATRAPRRSEEFHAKGNRVPSNGVTVARDDASGAGPRGESGRTSGGEEVSDSAAKPGSRTEVQFASLSPEDLTALKLADASAYFHVVKAQRHTGEPSAVTSRAELEAEAQTRAGQRVLRLLEAKRAAAQDRGR